MAVSLLSGGLSGIPFGVLLFRLAVAGAVFAVLALLLNLLFLRFFPELFEPANDEEQTDSGDDAESPGSRLNIVMPGEEPDKAFYEDAGEDKEKLMDNMNSNSGDFFDIDNEAGEDSSLKKSPMEGVEPEEMAHAIHTVLTRDEKG
ncbi:MAG: hypothetical protein CSA76_03070 [Spirochaetales bacterium]|nr:MAG: hypothetical protein CSA76_03070 [Spirochaetales bacterium]